MAVTITAQGYPDDVALTTGWLRAGTAFFLDTLARVDDLDAPSRLPGWSRRHVCAHVARNAEGLGRLLGWAATGVEAQMYASREAREADIERTAQAPADALRADVIDTAARLGTQLDALPAAAWEAMVATARGPLKASIVPWFRSREVWIHAVDLDAGAGFADLPDDVSAALVTELVTGLQGRDVSLRLVSPTAEWTVGDGAVLVEAPVQELAEWLTGRSSRPEAELPPWI